MQVGALIKRLSFKEFINLFWILIKKPLYILPTIQATRQTIDICNELYHKEHHLTGKPNAFRHALWNILICKKIFKVSKNVITSVAWAKTITDLHEELAPNDLLDKTMDLHNNEYGRQLFLEHSQQDKAELINGLQQQLKVAKKVSGLKEFKAAKGFMVYLNLEN